MCAYSWLWMRHVGIRSTASAVWRLLCDVVQKWLGIPAKDDVFHALSAAAREV